MLLVTPAFLKEIILFHNAVKKVKINQSPVSVPLWAFEIFWDLYANDPALTL